MYVTIYIPWMVYRKFHRVFFWSKQVSITKRPHQVQIPNLKNAVPVMSRTWTKGSPEKISVKLKTGWNVEKRWAFRKPGNFVTAATYQKQNKHPKIWVEFTNFGWKISVASWGFWEAKLGMSVGVLSQWVCVWNISFKKDVNNKPRWF